MKKFILFFILCVGIVGVAKMSTNVFASEGEGDSTGIVEEDKSSITLWIEEQFSFILTGLVGSLGSGVLLSLFANFLKKRKKDLIELGEKYGKSNEEMVAITNKVDAVCDKFIEGTEKATEKVTECISKVEDLELSIKEKIQSNDLEITTILKVIQLMALNNKELVGNGTASEIAKELNNLMKSKVGEATDESNTEN